MSIFLYISIMMMIMMANIFFGHQNKLPFYYPVYCRCRHQIIYEKNFFFLKIKFFVRDDDDDDDDSVMIITTKHYTHTQKMGLSVKRLD